MANPSSIVTVNITVQDATVSQAGFGTPLIMTHESPFGPELVRSYTSTADMVSDGFSASGATVAAATAILAQNPKPSSFKVGRRTSSPSSMTRIMTVATAIDDTNYTVTINGTAFTIDSGSSATVASIALALDAAINAGAEPVTSTDNLDGTFDLVEDVAGAIFGLTHTMTLITQDDTTADAGVAADYAAIKLEDNDFYGVLMTSSATLEIVALAAAVEADSKLFLVQTADSDVLADTAGNLFETLETSSYHRTVPLWNADNLDFGNAAWCSLQFAKDPGSSTWSFKTLAGVATDSLNNTQLGNIESNNGNHYTVTKGFSWALYGTAASGRFVDIQRGIDWFTVRMQERLLQLLNNSEKVPMTQPGITALESAVRAQCSEAVGQSVITDDFTVTAPDIDDVSSTNKSARILSPSIDFVATFQGAIHTLTVAGSVGF